LTNAKAEMQRIAQTIDKGAISDKKYKGERTVNRQKIYEVRDALKVIYYNKCAYCEDIEYKPEIEHYRPKNKVKEDKTHNGYYWLCYEWTNLIPSCRYCNTEGAKGSKFPIIGNRVIAPTFDAQNDLDFDACKAQNSPLIEEQPCLFHPEVDANIDANFEFLYNGTMRGTDYQGRGRQTIIICNLNRENLLFLRQEIIDAYFGRISNQLNLYFNKNMEFELFKKQLLIIFLKIQINSGPNKKFSALSKYIQRNFNLIIVPLFPTSKQRSIVQNAYRQFQNGTLL
jgi:hypothetical protein